MSAIKCDGLKKTYKRNGGETLALSSLSCDIQEGELVILTGPPSSGKSTLLSVVGGLVEPDEGECLIFGQNLFKMTDYERSQFRLQNIGYLFQDLKLCQSLTVFENVCVPLQLKQVAAPLAKIRALEALEQMGMLEKRDLYPSVLSQGERLLVALSRAFVTDAKILILDEPTLSLDHGRGVLVMTILRQLVLDHMTTVLACVTDVRLSPFAHRVFKMKDGQIANVFGEGEVGSTQPPYLKI